MKQVTMSFSISGGHLGFSAVENFGQGWQSLGIRNGYLEVISYHVVPKLACSKFVPGSPTPLQDLIEAAHFGGAKRIVSHTQTPWFCLCTLNTGCRVG